MGVLASLPLVPVAVVALLVLAGGLSVRADRIVSRLALFAFSRFVGRSDRAFTRRRERLQAAHVPTPYREYASRTLLYAAVVAVSCGIVGTYAVWGLTLALGVTPDTLPSALGLLGGYFSLGTAGPLLATPLFALTTLVVGLPAGVLTYYARWWFVDSVAESRSRGIDASLPQTVAFVHALSRSGMEFPKVMRILSENRNIYGESANEMQVAVRYIDLFNVDMLTAIQTMGRRSPSGEFREFSENLVSVLQSGRSLTEFLHDQYEEFKDEAEAQQEQLLDLLATFAEGYVTLFVAAPLFMITILVIIGLTTDNTIPILQLLVYLILPVANALFVLQLKSRTAMLTGEAASEFERTDDTVGDLRTIRRAEGTETQTDGGTVTEVPVDGEAVRTTRGNVERLAMYRRIRGLQQRLGSPVRTVLDHPTTLLWLTIPVAVVLTLVRLPAVTGGGPITLRAVDDLLVQAAVFVIGSFAVVYEIHQRRIEAIEAAVPDLLDRLASVNDAGMTVVESIDRVRGSQLGALDDELDRIWRDIQWGADVEVALRRFEARMRTRTISRVVTLLTNAMNASGDVATVLRIAADQAKADRRLKRQRSREMITYTLVVYISFFVFMVIIAALNNVLIPNLPTGSSLPDLSGTVGSIGATRIIGNLGSVDTEAYTLIFFHTVLLQGCLSGFVAGQMSGGSLKDGAKHAAILTALAYLGFLVMPVLFGMAPGTPG